MTLQGIEFEATGIWRCERVLLVLVFCFAPLGCGGGGGGTANPPPAATTSAGPTATEHFATQPGTGMFADSSSTAPTDKQCADIVPAMSETVPENQATHPDEMQIGITGPVNQTRARTTDLARLHDLGYSWEQWTNPFWFTRITRQYTGSTDMIFRFVACKYGIDEDAVRAQATSELSNWQQWDAGGDLKTEPTLCQRGDVNLFGFICANCCYQSWGIFQIKVYFEYMTWPMVNYSTTLTLNIGSLHNARA